MGRHDEIEDGMGFAGLAPSPEESRENREIEQAVKRERERCAKIAANTDREIWRETVGDFYAPSIHVTREGGIGINVGGTVFVMDVRDWHRLAVQSCNGDIKALALDKDERA